MGSSESNPSRRPLITSTMIKGITEKNSSLEPAFLVRGSEALAAHQPLVLHFLQVGLEDRHGVINHRRLPWALDALRTLR